MALFLKVVEEQSDFGKRKWKRPIRHPECKEGVSRGTAPLPQTFPFQRRGDKGARSQEEPLLGGRYLEEGKGPPGAPRVRL